MLRNRWIKVLMFVLCLVPVGWLAWRAWQENLTANPIEYITHFIPRKINFFGGERPSTFGDWRVPEDDGF